MDPDQPAPPETPFQAAAAASNGQTAGAATSHQPGADGGLAAEVLRESTLTLHAVEEIQTAVGVIQVQLAIALALALLSLSILTYSFKQGRPVP